MRPVFAGPLAGRVDGDKSAVFAGPLAGRVPFRSPETSVTRHLAWTIALASLLLGAAVGCGEPQARDASAPADRLGLEGEIALGRALAPAVEEALGGRFPDLAVQAYVRTVGQKVTRSTLMTDLPYRFEVLDAAQPREYALPGGVVFVTRGLLARFDTEAQLAAAIGHQLAHVNAGHVTAALREKADLALRRRVAAAGEVPPGKPPPDADVRRLVEAVRTAAYPAEAEREADALALDYLAAAGYNPTQMAAYLSRMSADEDRIRRAAAVAERKYADRRGRVAEEEYAREVLNRLRGP